MKKLLSTVVAEGLDSRVRKEAGSPAAMRCCWRGLKAGLGEGLDAALTGCLRAGRLDTACRVVVPPHTVQWYLMQFRFPFFLEGAMVTAQLSPATSSSEQWRQSPSASTTSLSVAVYCSLFSCSCSCRRREWLSPRPTAVPRYRAAAFAK